MSNLAYIINWPDVDDEHVTFQTRHEAVALLVDEGTPRGVVQEALTRAEDYGHNECRLSGGRVYIWTEDKPGNRPAARTLARASVAADLWWELLDNFVDLNNYARDIDTEAKREYLRGGFEILCDACPWGRDHDDRTEIVAALAYAHRNWDGPKLDTLGAR